MAKLNEPVSKVYFDNAATTRVHPKVIEKMLPYFSGDFGNPSSIHSYGRKARVMIEEARETIAGLINADASEIYFLSGGTEANNFAVNGIAKTVNADTGKKKLITSQADHHCVLDKFSELAGLGYYVRYSKMNYDGTVSIDDLFSLVDTTTSLVSLIHVNNETGAVNNLSSISPGLKEKKALLHLDAVQSFGKIPIDVKELGIDSLAASSHKISGPKGCGFAYIKNGTPFCPMIFGGSQERNRRGGTENVAGIAGFAEAAKIAHSQMNTNTEIVSSIKAGMTEGIKEIDKNIRINSDSFSSPYILSITFDPEFYNVDSEAMVMYMDINGVAVSSGAACSSGTLKPSHVILSMGRTIDEASATLRLSFCAENTLDEVDFALDVLKRMSTKFKK